MIFVDNNTNSASNLVNPNNKNTQQDIKIDSLQRAVNDLNTAVDSLQTSVDNLSTTMDAKYITQTQTLINLLSESITELSNAMAERIGTAQLIADSLYSSDGHIDTIVSSEGTINSLASESADITAETVDTSTIDTLTVSDSATIASATIQYLTAANAAITNYDVTNFSAENLEADDADISNIIAQVATIARINASLITVSDNGTWREPIGDVDNTELLKITIPAYSGITNIVTENDELNISIINNNLVSFNQNADIPIYRIDFESALNVATSYSSLAIDQEEYDLSVVENFEAIEFIYDGIVYRYNKSQLENTIVVDENLSMTYADDTITFITTDNTTLTDVLIYDNSLSGDNNVILYLRENVIYKVIHLGDSSYIDSYSEIVDRTYYINNVNTRSGTFTSHSIMNPNETELVIDVVSELPQILTQNTMYIVTNDSAYYSEDGSSATKMGASITQVSTNTTNITNIQNSIGQPSGIASLDSNGRVPYSQLPESAMEYQGTWDASTNTPELKDGTGTNGDFYVVSTSGTVNFGTVDDLRNVAFYVNDRVIYDGSTDEWVRLPAGEVRTVNGLSGDVVLTASNVNYDTNTTIKAAIDDKVSIVSGKGLSSNDFTDTLKDKLDNIAAGAEVNVQADWTQATTTADDYIKNKPNLAAVATSGSYADLSNKPTIPAAQVNSDWTAVSGVSQILNKPSLATVATSGSYADLSNKPTIPSQASDIGAVATTDVPSANINWATVLV